MTSTGVSFPSVSAISLTVSSESGISIPSPSGSSIMIGSVMAVGSELSHSVETSEPFIRLKDSLEMLLPCIIASHF